MSPKRVRRFRITMVAVLIAFGVSCESTAPTQSLDRMVPMRVGDQLRVPLTDINLRFLAVVEDARCPAGASCPSPGNAELSIAAWRYDARDTLFFNTRVGAREHTVGIFRITLVSLLPERANTDLLEQGRYLASFRVVEDGPFCSREARPAVSVTIVDSLTGAEPTLTNVSVFARSGPYADSAVFATYPDASGPQAIALAHERRGNYTVTVNADGYHVWGRDIVVWDTNCHVITADLVARLVRIPETD